MNFVYDDGGRKAAGFTGTAGDCVCRAIATVTGKPYEEIYATLALGNKTQRNGKRSHRRKHNKVETASHGINVKRKWFKDYMDSLGFYWVPLMGIGTGCQVHLCFDEMPPGCRMVVSVSKHYTAVINGVIHDTYNCSRGGKRCVYGYWRLRETHHPKK